MAECSEQSTALIPGRNWAPEHLGSVLLLGLGVSGVAVRDYCFGLLGKRISKIGIVVPSESGDSDAECYDLISYSSESEGERTCLGGMAALQDIYDVCIASPGISQFGELYQEAAERASEIISEVEFAWRESKSDSRWIGITGTNGKTTTTALCAHLLIQDGRRAAAVGNIGDTCIAAVASGEVDVYVAELSSYQLASTVRFAPDVAVVLNITPDHLAWHRTHEAYVQAKRKILANLAQREGSCAILDATCEEVRAFVKDIKAQGDAAGFDYIPMGTSEGIGGDMRQRCGSSNAAFLRDDRMLVVARGNEETELCHADELLIPGVHNVGNALMAAAAALSVGASPSNVSEGLRTFASLPHRIEACGTVNGAACYNDSKATNVDATLKALAAFDPAQPIVLLGGDDKGTDLTELVRAAEQHCKAVVCYGASRERFLEAFEKSSLKPVRAERLADALDAALALAGEGDIVLLSPACASFDEFNSFEHRGDVFKQLVAERSSG